jgi:hypothetical protein
MLIACVCANSITILATLEANVKCARDLQTPNCSVDYSKNAVYRATKVQKQEN